MFSVYVTTRERHFHLEKALPHWQHQNLNTVLVVEKREVAPTMEFLEEFAYGKVEVLALPKRNQGLSYIRQFVLNTAEARGEEGYILADDDLYPRHGDFRKLIEVALKKDVIGCGASNSYHGLMLGSNEILKTGLAFPIAGGWGHRVVGINTENAQTSGGYPLWDKVWADAELQRQGIAMMQMPWFIHTGCDFASLGNRYTPGGMEDYLGEKRKATEDRIHARMHKRWPDYVSRPGTPYRCQWKKMMNDYLPGWQRQVPKRVRDLQEGK
jgi:hypothetical protein